jgi:hypothetical protein
MKGKQIKRNACLFLYLFIAPFVLFAQNKKLIHYNGGTLYSEVVQKRPAGNDTTLSSKITGTNVEVRIDRSVKKFTVAFTNDDYRSIGMVFEFVRYSYPENTQPRDKLYLMEYQNQYYFLADNIDNPLVNELTISAEKLLPDNAVFIYKIKGLKQVK